ncbi:SGNH/GDSL hydrolase family protein [Microbacterium sp. ZW T2_14]|uniref:SGNH/GDSL hydrolase family protein n=1 Tax=Microbacterium sp. ZW T2_14 TaxID=3378079 RepID=UPI003854CFD9
MTGTVGADDGKAVRVLVVGESTAAGCGAATHDEAFAGAFARALADRGGETVHWQVRGHHGATIRRVRHRMLDDEAFDVAVLLIGVNDVLNRTRPVDWGLDLAAVLDHLTVRVQLVVVAGIPPFAQFPSLPGALGRYLGSRGQALDEIAEAECATHSNVVWISSTGLLTSNVEIFARDGFHPSPVGYKQWARAVAERIDR